MAAPNFFAELKHRNVYKVAVAYAVVAWLLIQIATQVFPFFEVPNWAVRLVVLLLALGFPVALILAWAFELTPEGIKRAQDVAPNEPSTRRTGRKLLGITIALAAIAAGLFVFQLLRSKASNPHPLATSVLSEKSIAVLPFENLSNDQENAFFTDGVQDEILTDLARVADLKVISRTSVMPYKNAASRNLREIAAQLQVAHVVEGSVQRAGNQVRVTAQLIDARTDVHQWAMHYDRPLQDVFAIQSEIAQAIADQLRAHISPEEHAAMTQPPTTDVLALQLYQQAQDLESRESDPNAGEGLLQAVGLLEQAIERDPHFLAAQCLLVRTHLDLYWEDFEHTDARREQARAALAKAVQLKPDAGETRIAQANYQYRVTRDYDRAVSELALARRTLPNSAEVPQLLGVVYRRQGRWDDALHELTQAVELDPRNFQTLQQTAFTYTSVSRYDDARGFLKRALAIVPGDIFVRETLAAMSYYQRAELQELKALNASIVAAAKPAELTDSAYFRLLAALAERNEPAAKAALKDLPARGFQDVNNFFIPPEWYAGRVARAFGDTTAAQNAFTAARAKLEQTTRTAPDYAEAWSALGLVDAALGRKADAIAEARRGCELLPISKDAFDGPSLATNLAIVYAWTGEKDLALDQLNIIAHLKGGLNFSGVSYGVLKHELQWDPLRGDPRFEKIVAELAPRS